MTAQWTARSESNHPDDVEWCARQKWLEERRKGIGASEVAAILGLDPWRSALGVWADKTGAASEDRDSEAMEIGRELEEPIARMFGRRFPEYEVGTVGQYSIWHHSESPLLCTLDRVLTTEDKTSERNGWDGVLEIKASSKTDEWAGGPPLRYVVQVQGQLACTGRRWGYLAALLGGRKLVTHRIERDDAFIERMLDQVRAFWKLVETRTEPPVSKPYDLAVIKLLHPSDSGVTEVANGAMEAVVSAWEGATKAKRDAEETHKLAEATLRQAIGATTWLTLSDGRQLQSKVEPRKAEQCESCGHVVRKATEPRVLRLVKGRK